VPRNQYAALVRGAKRGLFPNLTMAFNAGGARRAQAFQTFMQNDCKADECEALMIKEAKKETSSQLDGEYLSLDELLLRFNGDASRVQQLVLRRRSDPEGVVIDHNDGQTERFWYATKHATMVSFPAFLHKQMFMWSCVCVRGVVYGCKHMYWCVCVFGSVFTVWCCPTLLIKT